MVTMAKVCKLNPHIEEEIIVAVGGFIIMCFANVRPYKIYLNETYPVELSFTILDDWFLEEEEFVEESAIVPAKCTDAGVYYLYGKLNGDVLEVRNLTFQDDVFLTDYAYLNGKFISLLVDRINIEFL